jgi:hypothetical protein
MKMSRMEWFKNYSSSKILDYFETDKFLEVTVNKYGDIITYRVYGDNEKEYYLTER